MNIKADELISARKIIDLLIEIINNMKEQKELREE